MSKNTPSLLLVIAVLVLGAAVVLPDGVALDRTGPETVVVPAAPPVLRYVIAALGAVVILSLIVLRFTVLRGEADERPPGATRWRFLALLLVILALWATFVAFRTEPVTGDDEATTVVPSPSRGAAAPDEDEAAVRRQFSETLGWAVTGIFVVGALAAGGVLFFLLRREDAGPAGRRPRAALRAQVEAGVEDLLAIEDPRAAVIACYSRMETVVEMSGIEPHPADTPFELLHRLLRAHDVLESSAARLTQLFEEAKFSLNPIDEPMRQEALDALIEVRDQLRRARAPQEEGVR